MRKFLLALVLLGFIAVLTLTLKPQVENLVVSPEPPLSEPSENKLSIDIISPLSVIQGGSARALSLENRLDETVNFSIAHEHEHLNFQPQSGSIIPGARKQITVNADPDCPTGKINLSVYLRAEANGERFGMESEVTLDVKKGELSLDWRDDVLYALLNNQPVSSGVVAYYRIPGSNEWGDWGKLPESEAPVSLDPGSYELEFKAVLGAVSSEVETFVVKILEVEEELIARKGDPADLEPVEELAAGTDEPEPEKLKPAPAAASSSRPPEPKQPEQWVQHPDPVRQNFTAYKLVLSGNPRSGKYYFRDFIVSTNNNSPLLPPDAHIRINFGEDGRGQYFSWSANIPIREVLVSGGPTYNFYSHTPSVVGDYYLHAPVIHGGENYYQIQHITFYYCGNYMF